MEASSRKRQLGRSKSGSRSFSSGRSTPLNAYRLHFSCEHIGKYRSQTKRKIKWHFGFTNLQAAQEGKRGIDCRGEEHEVVLIWSVKSGKTRLFWNKTNITHLFPGQRHTEQVHIQWKSRSGETFEIVANQASTRVDPYQYNFLVDGVSIFTFSHLSELDPSKIVHENSMRNSSDNKSSSSNVSAKVRSEPINDTRSDGGGSMECCDTMQESLLDAGFRLSMAGLAPSSQFAPLCEPVDDLMDDLLPSTPFNNVLESLRQRITSIIPDSNDMVSRAIVKALSDDIYELSSCSSSLGSSSFDSLHQSAMQIAAEAVWETSEWINHNVHYAPRPDVLEQKREFFQRQMESVFIHAHHERLSEDAATRILSDVATLLGIDLCTPVPRDTILLSDLDKATDKESLLVSLVVYGEIQEVGMPPNGQRFAICRFSSERGPLRALSAAEHGLLLINGRRPQVRLLERPLVTIRPTMVQRAYTAPHASTLPIAKPSLGRRKSHQRNTIHIDTLISETPFLRLVNDPAIISPGEDDYFLQSNPFGKLDPLHEVPASIPAENSNCAVAASTLAPFPSSGPSPFTMKY
ncbi:hypothetical protein IV203_038421 [Nitzschia inconspicua]|uniref:RRM domain-containing protein n=1 Tax=Nitzschia inconspicua TaxID=303405 RepID=A0A9K3PZ90_9STRA|nr:hypothetical protein IV203_038421 [Nitzschia inconspicua]